MTTTTHITTTTTTATGTADLSVRHAPPSHEQVALWSRTHLSAGRAALNELMTGEHELSASGSLVVTDTGTTYLNCAGYGTQILGARHPVVVDRVRRQLDESTLSSKILPDVRTAEAAHRLAAVMPSPDLVKVHFTNSGAEATETALKLARAGGARRIVTTTGGFHGKTLGALSATPREVFQRPFTPLLPDVEVVPYGDAAALEAALTGAPRSVVIVEPVQGEAGVVVPPDGYLAAVEAACRRHDAVFVVDEVQTGFARTGPFWASSREGVHPDVLLTGKGLSGGVVPVAAAVATAAVYRPFDADPFLHTSTYGGNPLAMAAVLGALDAMVVHDVPARSQRTGEVLLPGLRALAAAFPATVREVRGRGCLLGVELHDEGTAGEVLLGLLDQRVLVNHSLNNPAVLRLTPSALLEDADLTRVLDAFTAAVSAAAR